MLTMVLGGLWHGAAWTFVVWGAIHGGFLARRARACRSGGSRAGRRAGAAAPRSTRSLRWLLTFHVVCLAWIFFRAETFGTAFEVLGGLVTGGGPHRSSRPLLVLVIDRPCSPASSCRRAAVERVQAALPALGAGAPGRRPRRRPHRHRRPRPRRRRPLHLLPVLMPTHRPTAPAPSDSLARRRAASSRPAGAASIMLVALALAALVNADALVERASASRSGSSRDRSLAIWHPVQDVAHSSSSTGSATSATRSSATRTTAGAGRRRTTTVPDRRTAPPRSRRAARRCGPRPPPRRCACGSAATRSIRDARRRRSCASPADDPLFDADLHYGISTGPDPARLLRLAGCTSPRTWPTEPEVVVDHVRRQRRPGLIAADGDDLPAGERPRVAGASTRRRVGGRDGPAPRRRPPRVLGGRSRRCATAGFDARMEILNDIYREAAESRPWIELVDTGPLFGDADGGYADRLPGADGEPRATSGRSDGIHLSRFGADRLADHLLGLMPMPRSIRRRGSPGPTDQSAIAVDVVLEVVLDVVLDVGAGESELSLEAGRVAPGVAAPCPRAWRCGRDRAAARRP